MSRTWTEIVSPVLRDNIRCVRAAVEPRSDLIFVVKADAYGHGMPGVVKVAWDEGVRRFAVAHLDEAETLRQCLPDAQVLMIGVLDPATVARAAALRLVPALTGPRHADALAREARQAGVVLPCHVKIDTGMGRLGFDWQRAVDELRVAGGLGGLRIEGAYTHLAASDAADRAFADEQMRRFRLVVAGCRAAGIPIPFLHVSNSGAFQRDREWHLDAVRMGILLYGYPPIPAALPANIRPFLQWKTRVIQIRDVPARYPVSYDSTFHTQAPTRLAVLNVGYADGYSRALSNRGMVLLGGRRCPGRGRLTMNLTMVDAGPDAPVKEGDEVVLIGCQGGEMIGADELAQWQGTIAYEVLTSIRTPDRREA